MQICGGYRRYGDFGRGCGSCLLIGQICAFLPGCLGIHEDAQHKAENHEKRAKKGGCLFQHVCRLGAEHLIRHLTAESGTKAFLLRTLHQHDEQQQGGDDEKKSEDNVDGGIEKHGGILSYEC